MKANPDKFQAIAGGKRTKAENITFNLDDNNIIINCEKYVKHLGVAIDFKFRSQIGRWGEWRGDLHMLILLKLLMVIFIFLVTFNVASSAY